MYQEVKHESGQTVRKTLMSKKEIILHLLWDEQGDNLEAIKLAREKRYGTAGGMGVLGGLVALIGSWMIFLGDSLPAMPSYILFVFGLCFFGLAGSAMTTYVLCLHARHKVIDILMDHAAKEPADVQSIISRLRDAPQNVRDEISALDPASMTSDLSTWERALWVSPMGLWILAFCLALVYTDYPEPPFTGMLVVSFYVAGSYMNFYIDKKGKEEKTRRTKIQAALDDVEKAKDATE